MLEYLTLAHLVAFLLGMAVDGFLADNAFRRWFLPDIRRDAINFGLNRGRTIARDDIVHNLIKRKYSGDLAENIADALLADPQDPLPTWDRDPLPSHMRSPPGRHGR